MKFLYPEFLWALSLISIPIIIHLFNFRKFQKIYFSNIGLLKEVKLETKSKSQLKHYLLLALRILAITALVFAFAQPFFPSSDIAPPGDNHISIFIDNSHSMDSKGENGYRLDLAKEQAIELVNGFAPTDQFQVITNDFEGRHQRFYNKSDCINLIDEIKPSFSSKKMSEVYTRQSELFRDVTTNKTAFWLSDFQKNSADFDQLKLDSSIKVVCLPYYHQKAQNLSIDSVFFETPVRRFGAEDRLIASIKNQSDQDLEFKLLMYNNGAAQAFLNFEIAANAQKNCELPYTINTPGVQHCALEITDYPDADLTFDDTYYFSYFVKPIIKIHHIYENTSLLESELFLKTLFGTNTFFEYKSSLLSMVEFGSINENDFIILSDITNITSGLNSTLQTYINQGGNVLIFPAKNSNILSYNDFLASYSNVSLQSLSSNTSKISKLATEHPLYQGIFDEIPANVDLPTVLNYYSISNPSTSNFTSIMTLQSGNPFLAYLKLPSGSISLCAAPLSNESSNFPKHALFVPTLLRLAEFSQTQQKYSYTIGKEISVSADSKISNSDGLIIKKAFEEGEFKPEIKKTNAGNSLLFYDQIKTAGPYSIVLNNETIGGFSYNYNRIESSQDFHTNESLLAALETNQLSASFSIMDNVDSSNPLSIAEQLDATKYWKILILLTLIFLAGEVAVYRLWK
jgi:hypothetical protein